MVGVSSLKKKSPQPFAVWAQPYGVDVKDQQWPPPWPKGETSMSLSHPGDQYCMYFMNIDPYYILMVVENFLTASARFWGAQC
jgi:hypothetical protein